MDLNNIDTVEGIIETVKVELEIANKKFPLFNSQHEGFAVLKEEVDELWDDVKGNAADSLTKAECVQVAAMAIKMLQSPIWKS